MSRLSRGLLVVGAVLLLSSPSALAQAPDPLAVGVWLDQTSPVAGSAVTGVRHVGGTAQAPEGVLSVSLYVVPAAHPLDLVADQPVATSYPLLPVGEIVFAFDWDTATAPGRVVDVHVVATTLLRDVGAAVPGLRIEAARVTAPVAGLAPTRPSRRPGVVPPAVTERRQESSRLGVYLGGYDEALPYQRTLLPAPATPTEVSVRPAASASSARRSGWLSAALGLMLIVGAAHVHRLLRPLAPPVDPRGSR